MKFITTPLAGAYVVEQTPSRDERGYFARVFCEREFGERGLCTRFVQTNHSLFLKRGTLRGLHYQLPPYAEVRLFRCIRGAVQDVMVDVRQGSPTFLRWHTEVLSEDNLKMVYVPAGFAHGCQALEDGSAITYQCSNPYTPSHERRIRYDDPALGIEWRVAPAIVSQLDRNVPNIDQSFAGVVLAVPTSRPHGPRKRLPRTPDTPYVAVIR